jgi:ubiquinone/menaquinone biosynthesis C-methylase UbiE
MSHKGHPYSASGAFFLDNPIRRLIQPPSELIEKLAVGTDYTVVDFGCGPGFFTMDLAKKVKVTIAVDLSTEMLEKASNKAQKAGVKNIRFLRSDGKNLQIDNSSVDMVLLVTVYHEIGEGEAVLREFWRILKPQGRLNVVEASKKGLFPGPPVQNPETLRAEIEAGNFKLVQKQHYRNFCILSFTKNS